MAGLPKKYIKKYGVSKKAWAEYRKVSGKTKTRKSTKRKIKVSRTMAKRRKSYSRKKKAGFLDSVTVKKGMNIAGTILYGGTRAKISDAIGKTKVAQMLPVLSLIHI